MRVAGVLPVILFVWFQACAQGEPDDIHVVRIENDCRHGSPPSTRDIDSMLRGIPPNSFDQVTTEHVNHLLALYGGVRVTFRETQVKIRGSAGKLSKTDDLPVRAAVFLQPPTEMPLVYFKLVTPTYGPYRASVTSGTVKTLCSAQ